MQGRHLLLLHATLHWHARAHGACFVLWALYRTRVRPCLHEQASSRHRVRRAPS